MEREASPPPSPAAASDREDREQAQLLPRAAAGDGGARARLLQALALPQWLVDSAAEAPGSAAAGGGRRADWGVAASPRSRRRSASSATASEASAQRARMLANLRRSESMNVHSEAEMADTGADARAEEAGARTADSEPADADDQSAMEELQALVRRCHHSLPFVALFLVYFAYQHATGIMVFVVGTIAIVGLDQRVRAQIALKDKASIVHLIGIVGMCAIDMVALCTVNGEPNPFLHISRMLEASSNHKGAIWDVVWIVVVNGAVLLNHRCERAFVISPYASTCRFHDSSL